jgi:hypothetical protein
MTLVACWSNGGSLVCVADSRISAASGGTITETGAKLFTVPIHTQKTEKGLSMESSYHTLGFAFAGSTLVAGNTHAIASNLTQQLNRTGESGLPALTAIAEIYAKVCEYVTKDVNSRVNPVKRTDSFVQAFLFGYCPKERKLKLATLYPELTPTTFRVLVEIQDPEPGLSYSIGSGATAFSAAMKAVTKMAPMDVVRLIIESGQVADVGGYLQMATASSQGVRLHQIAAQHPTNPDLGQITFLGFDLAELGEIDGFSVGFDAIGIGTEKIMARRALRAKGINPDVAPIPRELQNLASIEMMLQTIADIGPTAKTGYLDQAITVSQILPESGTWYLTASCEACHSTVPLCLDPFRGKVQRPFSGPGSLKTQCWKCREVVSASATQTSSQLWN